MNRSGLFAVFLRSWSGPVTVFFRSCNRTSKHYLRERARFGGHWINDNLGLPSVLANYHAWSFSRPMHARAHWVTYLIRSHCHSSDRASLWLVPLPIATVPVLFKKRERCKWKPVNWSKDVKRVSRKDELLLRRSSRVKCFLALLQCAHALSDLPPNRPRHLEVFYEGSFRRKTQNFGSYQVWAHLEALELLKIWDEENMG